MRTIHDPGVYFGMPEDEYHADGSLSASGVKSLMVSPLTYWADTLDPEREDEEETPSQIKGKAAHKAVLEGLDAFNDAYAIEPDPDDYPDHVAGGADIRALCKAVGVKANGTINEMCERIIEMSPMEKLWPLVMAEFEEIANGKKRLKPDVGKYVVRTHKLVHANPHVSRAVTGGFAEVSIFWKDEDGIPWKVRVDYLKSRAGIDMKTFTNMHSKPLATAVAHAVAQHRYHVQAALYLRALEAAKDLPFYGDHLPSNEWLTRFQKSDPRFVFLFVETGRVPNVLLREFSKTNSNGQETLAHQAASAALDQCAGLWSMYSAQFGDAPWVLEEPMRSFDDVEFPLYMTE